ncbi:MAG: heme-binding protein [Ktedonobacteraceae bacterium]
MSLTIDVARRVLEACKQRASELRSPVSIAIVDAGGHLVLFERMMSPYGWATGNISLAKATTAVMFNQSTDAVAQWGAAIPGFASSMAEMSQGKFIMAAGGWPLRMNGATIGGIGVSGGNAPGRDDDVARAGLAALEGMFAAVPMIPPTRHPAQQIPASYVQPIPTGMQPSPAYPSQPYRPQEPLAASTANLDMARELASQENPYGEEPSQNNQYNESSESSGT